MLERIDRGKLTKAELAIKNKRLRWEEKQKTCVICQEQKPTDFDGYCQDCHDEIASRNVREGTTP